MKLAPRFWVRWLVEMFGASEPLAVALWQAYPVSATTLFQLRLCDEPAPSPEASRARVCRLGTLIPPATLIALSLRLSPEGQKRKPDMVAFEEMVLAYSDRHGHWRDAAAGGDTPLNTERAIYDCLH
jgi:hypothetical protein